MRVQIGRRTLDLTADPSDRRAAAPIMLEGDLAVTALPTTLRWSLFACVTAMSIGPLLMQRFNGEALGAFGTGLWIGSLAGALVLFRRAGLLRMPFVVAAILVFGGIAALTATLR